MKASALTPKPFTVIGGFLGAGKTTLLNRILREGRGTRFAVLVNDFGDINIDASLIESHDGQTMALANGCICCSLANGFITTIINLMKEPDCFDHVVIEASGVSEPDRIMDFARIDRDLAPAGIIVLVDAATFADRLVDPKLTEIMIAQIQSADLLVINKADLASAEKLSSVERAVAAISPDTPRLVVSGADVPLELLLGTPGNEPGHEAGRQANGHAIAHQHDHGRADEMFFTRSLVSETPVDKASFEAFVTKLPPEALRGKGYVRCREGMFLWQKVGAESTLTPAEPAGVGETRIVLIGTAPLDEIILPRQMLVG